MKKFRVIAVLAIALCFLLGTTTVYGAYDIGITVSGGNGSIDGSIAGTKTITVDTTNSEINGLTVEPPEFESEPDKYFMRGVKLAGHDNDELYVGEVSINTPGTSFYNKDTEMVVAYGLKSNMVKYTISYVTGTTELLPSETHYGVIGDSPIVSYKYVEGYLPDAYNARKTLSDDVSQNVITFTYTPVQAAEGNTIINNNGNANAAAGNAGVNAAGNAAAGNAAANAGTAIGDNATPLAINDQDTPLANADQEKEGGRSPWPYIIGGVIAAAIIAAIAAFLARRKGAEEE